MTGPLSGLRVLELGGIGPTPFAGMLLADMGADVVRIDRTTGDPRRGPRGTSASPAAEILNRGKRSLALNLKHPDGRDAVLKIVESTDVVIEGFRPGVAERLGVGPDHCTGRNPGLIYGRMTGWGQDGPYADMAGHDINYIAVAGVLESIGRVGQPPTPPLSYIGDFGGGSMFLLYGVMCALYERQRSGRGQIVDAAMTEGAAMLSAPNYQAKALGLWPSERGRHRLAGAAPHYDAYACADGKYVSIASNEPQFYALLREKLNLTDEIWHDQHDQSAWPERKKLLAELFAQRSREDWCRLLEYSDVCFAPVLTIDEVADHPHNRARGTFVERGGVLQPAPAPRFSRTPTQLSDPPTHRGEHSISVLLDYGFREREIADLLATDVVADGKQISD